MAINLKQISLSDTNNIKLDKVNYNFDQLVANGGGPQGFQGNPGNTGYQGVTGYKGNQGSLGDQGAVGVQGTSGQGIWKENGTAPNSTKTLLPTHDTATHGPNAPTVAIGYKSDSDFYQNGVEENVSLLLNRGTNSQNNLELRTEGSDNAFYYRLSSSANLATMITGFRLPNSGSSAVLKQYATEFQWISEDPNAVVPLISLDGTKLQVNVNADFDSPVTIKDTLKISGTASGAAAGKIAVSANTSGLVDFKTIEEIGGVVPLGTIVSVDPSFFSTNFILNQTNVASGGDATSAKFKVGAGANNFAGWYLCNGKEWTNGAGIDYQTEDLNSFSYTIEDNPDSLNASSQGAATQSDYSLTIIGGSSVTMDANYTAPNYNITGSVSTTSTPIGNSQGGTTFTIKKLPQIVYLGTEDLYWQDKGIDQAPTTVATYRFIDGSTDALVAAMATVVVPSQSGNSGTFNVSIPAPNGQYWDNNNLPAINPASIIYTIDSVTTSGTTGSPENLNIQVSYTSHPNADVTVDFPYDSSGSIVVIPITEAIDFTFTDTYGGVSTMTHTETDLNGSSGSFTVSIPADSNTPTLQYWNAAPTFALPGGPEGYNITNSNLYDPDGDGYAQVWTFTVTYSSFPYSGPVNFNYSSNMSRTTIPITTIANTYNLNQQTHWTAGNISRTVTATPGDTATVGTFTLTADTGRYFNNAIAPVTSYVYRGGSTLRGSTGSWDVSVSSYTFSGSVGGDTNKPTSLSITLEDIDFADASAISAGTTQDTYISMSADTVAIPATEPYVMYTSQWTGGNSTWNSTNYTNKYVGVLNEPNRSWNIDNDTSDPVNIRLKVSEYTGASTGSILSAQISYQNTGGSTLYQSANTGGSANTSGYVISYSTASTFTIPAGGSIDITWNLLSVPNGTGWVASLQYWSGTGASPGLTNESVLSSKLI
jgi:hypothetical protein